jgi:glycosyltransferase involved in cell wall biosynthesis
MATSLQSPLDAAPAAAARRPCILVVMYSNPDYHPPTVNGVRMMSERFEVHIVCRNDVGPRVEWPPAVTVERIGSAKTEADKQAAAAVRKLAEFAAFARAARRAAARFSPAVIYAYDAMGFAVAAWVARAYPAALLIFHSHELPALERRSPRSLQPWVMRYALDHTHDADLVVFPSAPRARVWMAAAHDERRACIVPNASSLRFYHPPADFTDLIARRFARRRVVYLGSLGPINGHREAVRALAMLDRDIALDLIGSAEPAFRDELTALARELGIDKRVDLAGWLPDALREERVSAACAGLVLYQPANPNWEHAGSSPNKIFEYAAMGLPVVAPDLPSYREFFAADEWVAYADPEDPASIARAIEFILADRERYIAMSLAARRAHEEKYNYEHVFAPVIDRILALTTGLDSAL